MKLKIGIVSAEPSGDLLASKLIENLEEKFNEVELIGVGSGPLGKYKINQDRKELEIMGLIDPVINYRKIKNFQNELIEQFISAQIDVFIGVDSPDFNFGIHKSLKKNDIPTVQVVCPSVWAWRPNRTKHFKHIDYMLCLFAFELNYTSNVNNSSFCIGHPLVEKANNSIKKEPRNQICLLPGSRQSEIKNNIKIMIDAFNIFNSKNNFTATIPCYNEGSKNLVNSYLKNENNIKSTLKSTIDVLSESKAAIICSGTATLEAFLLKVPSAIVYKTNFLNYLILKKFVKSKFIGLPNIISNQQLYKEFVQSDFTKENIAKEIENLVTNRNQKKEALDSVDLSIERPNFKDFVNKFYEDCRSR